jgi:hypothetical protein
MKKKAQLMGFMIIALLTTSFFIGCIGEELKEKEQTKSLENLSKEWKWYENKEWGFKLKYPAGWESSVTTNDKEKGFGIRFCPSVGKENERDVFFIMILDALDLSLEEVTNDSIDISGITFGQPLKILEYKNTTLSGEPATQIVFKVEKRKGRVTEDSKGLIINAIKREKTYTIIYYSPWKNYSKGIKISKEMIKSFKFIKVEK